MFIDWRFKLIKYDLLPTLCFRTQNSETYYIKIYQKKKEKNNDVSKITIMDFFYYLPCRSLGLRYSLLIGLGQDQQKYPALHSGEVGRGRVCGCRHKWHFTLSTMLSLPSCANLCLLFSSNKLALIKVNFTPSTKSI